MKKSTIYSIIISIIFISCSSTKIIEFSEKPDDIHTTESLRKFLNINKNPKVVLRVSNSVLQETKNLRDEDSYDYLYNIIENQLLKSGFQVRDRQLFEQITGNDLNTLDYENIKTKSDTELIIEISRFEPDVLYKTNVYTNKKGKSKVEEHGNYEKYGAIVEFKIVLITKNEFAGSYSFNYTPCTSGCVIEQSISDRNKQLKKMRKKGVEPYRGTERDELEEFMIDASNKLVIEMRK